MSQSAALFGQPPKVNPRHLLQFRAGKMTESGDKMIKPDPRKGWAYIYQSSDGKLNFCWIDRKTRLVEDNFVIAAKSAEFVPVSECKSGRVYVLKMSGSKRFFIWMQEPSEKNDTNICSRINSLIKSPPAQQSTMGVGITGGIPSDTDISQVHATASTIGQNNLEASGIRVPAVQPSEPSRPVSSDNKSGAPPKFQLQDLRSILSNVSKSSATVELSGVLNMQNLQSLLERPDVQQRLLPHLPQCDPESSPASDMDRITANIRSAPFKATLSSFSSAFHAGALAPVLSQFKLGDKADEAAKLGDLTAFSRALQPSSAGGTSKGAPTSSSSNSSSANQAKKSQTRPGVKDKSKKTTESDKDGEGDDKEGGSLMDID